MSSTGNTEKYENEQEESVVPNMDGSWKAEPVASADVADIVLRRHRDEAGHELSEKDVKRVIGKIDMLMMPLMFFIYLLNYTDKNLFATGANFKLVQDLGLFVVNHGVTQTSRYSNATTIYYVGFIVGAPITSRLAQRFPTAKVCALAVMAWGMTCAFTALCQNYTGTMVQRTLLGVCESGVLPCLILLTGSWYTQKEQGLRLALWLIGAPLAAPLTVPINYGLLHINGSLANWRIMYLFWGCLTFAYGILLFFILPSTPANAWHLNEHEKFVAVERLRVNQAGIGNRHFKKEQAIEALTDPKVILVGLIAFCTNAVNAVSSAFVPILFTHLLHASPYRSLVLGLPISIYTGVVAIIVGVLSQVLPNSQVLLVLSCELVCLIASVLLWVLPQTNASGLFAGICLLGTFLSAVILVYGFSTANVAGGTKKATATAWVVMCLNASNAAGPQWFKSKDAPRYTNGFIAIAITQVSAILMTVLYGWLCLRDNRRRDAMGEVGKVDRAFKDLTDKENLSFR